MTGSIALDIVVGLMFVYLLYSLLATILQEIVSTLFDLRSGHLKEAIKRMLDDDTKTDTFSESFYSAPIIKYFAREGRKPSYLSAQNFSKVVIDLLRGENPRPGDDFRRKIDESLTSGILLKPKGQPAKPITEGGTFTFLQSLWADSHGDIEKFRIHLEQWYDNTMDRTSGWYKRYVQKILFGIGFAIAVVFNVDTIEIANKLSTDPELRKQMVLQADAFLKAHPNLDKDLKTESGRLGEMAEQDSVGDSTSYKSLSEIKARRDSLLAQADRLVKTEINALNGALGTGIHNYEFKSVGSFFKSLAGWILTALAISLGAPFWFDLLNKFMKLRSSTAIKADAQGPDTGGKISDKSIVTVIKG